MTSLPISVSAQSSNSSDAAAIAALVQKVNELEQHDRELQERIRVLGALEISIDVGHTVC